MAATLVVCRPVGVVGGWVSPVLVAWKVAVTAYQSVLVARVAVPCWGAAVEARMSSAKAEPLPVWARAV